MPNEKIIDARRSEKIRFMNNLKGIFMKLNVTPSMSGILRTLRIDLPDHKLEQYAKTKRVAILNSLPENEREFVINTYEPEAE